MLQHSYLACHHPVHIYALVRTTGWRKGSAPPEVLNCLILSYGILTQWHIYV